MTSPEIKMAERTVYPALVEYLKDIGFSVGSEIRISKNRDAIDVLFRFGRQSFIVEVKISGESKSDSLLPNAIVQAWGYAHDLHVTSKNLLIIIYPYDVRGALHDFDEIAGR